MADEIINARITADTAQAEQSIRTIKRDLKSLGDDAKELISPLNMVKTALASLSAWSGIQGARSLIETALAMERLNTQFKVITESSILGAAEFRFVAEESKRLGQEITVLAAAYSRLLQATKGGKFEGAPTRAMFSGFSEAFTALKMTSDQMGGVWLQINQGMMKGKIQLEDVNIIAERGLNIIKLLELSTGKSTKELMAMIGKSELLADEYMKLGPLLHQIYGDQAKSAAQELQGTIKNFTNEFFKLKASIADGFTPAFTSSLKTITANMKEIVSTIGTIGVAIAAVFTGRTLNSFATKLAAASPALGSNVSTYTTGLMGGASNTAAGSQGAAIAENSARTAAANQSVTASTLTAAKATQAYTAATVSLAEAELRRLVLLESSGAVSAKDKVFRQEMTAATRALTIAERELAASKAATVAATEAATLADNANAAAKARQIAVAAEATIVGRALAAATWAIEGATKAAGIAFNAIGGWIGIVVIALTTAVMWWNSYKKAKEDAIKAKPEATTELDVIQEQIKMIKKEIAIAKGDKKALGLIETKETDDTYQKQLNRYGENMKSYNTENSKTTPNKEAAQQWLDNANAAYEAANKIKPATETLKALQAELKTLNNKPITPAIDTASINEAAGQYDRLKGAMESMEVKAVRAGKSTNELAAMTEALRLEQSQLYAETMKAANTDKSAASAEDMRVRYEAALKTMTAEMTLADYKKGAMIERKSLLHSELETVKNTQAETLAAIELQEATHTITALQGMKLRQDAMKDEAAKIKKILKNALTEAQSNVTDLDNLTGKDTIDKKSSQYKKALDQVTQAQSALDTATSKSNQTLTANAVATVKSTEAARDHAISVENEVAAMNAKNSASAASMVGTNATGGFDTLADQTKNQMAILEDAHKRELEMIEERRNAIMIAARDKGVAETGAVQKIKALAEEERLAYEKTVKARAKIAYDRSPLGGMTEAIKEYGKVTEDVASQVHDAFTNAFKGMEDALTEFVQTGKLNFSSLAKSIQVDIIRMTVSKPITNAVSNGIGNVVTGMGSWFSSGSSSIPATTNFAAVAGTSSAIPASTNFATPATSSISAIPVIGAFAAVGYSIVSQLLSDNDEAEKRHKAALAMQKTINASILAGKQALTGEVNAAAMTSLLESQYSERENTLESLRNLSNPLMTDERKNEIIQGEYTKGLDEATNADYKSMRDTWRNLLITQELQRKNLETMQSYKLGGLHLTEMELQGLQDTKEYIDLLNTSREVEIAKLDKNKNAFGDSEQSIQRNIFVLQDAAKATEKVTKATEELTKLQTTNAGLMKGTLSLYGDQAIALQRELELKDITDESTKAVKQYVWAMEDQVKAQGKATAAAKTAVLSSISLTQSILQTKLGIMTNSANLSPEAAYLQAKDAFASADKNNISERSNALEAASRNYNASGAAYQLDRQNILDALDKFSGTAGDVSDVQKQLTLLGDLKTAVESGDTAVLNALNIQYNVLAVETGSAATSLITAQNAMKKALQGYDASGALIMTGVVPTAGIPEKMAILKTALEGKNSDGTYIISDVTARGGVGALYNAMDSALKLGVPFDPTKNGIQALYSNMSGLAAQSPLMPTATQGIQKFYASIGGLAINPLTMPSDSTGITKFYSDIGGKANTPITMDTSTGVAKFYTDIKGAGNTEIVPVYGTNGGIVNFYSALKTKAETGIDITTAVTAIQGSTGFGGINDALDVGLNDPTTGVSSLVETFSSSLTESARTTKLGLENFVNALSIVGEYTSARQIAQPKTDALNEQYRAGTISIADYNNQTAAATAPLNDIISRGKGFGLTTLTGATAISAADTDRRMARKFFDFAGNYSSYTDDHPGGDSVSYTSQKAGFNTAPYDLNKDGKIGGNDELWKWFDIAMGNVAWSSLGLPAFASGGYHSGGLRLVGENGPELEATGSSRIWNMDQTKNILRNGSADNRELVAELKIANSKLTAMEKRLATIEVKARLVANA
jgi:tape measure domain-containing protein